MVARTSTLTAEEFRQRQTWASSRGLRWWLWPAIDPAAWSAALRQIVDVTRDVLAAGSSATALQGDAAAFSVAAYTSGMGPLLGFWLEKGSIAVDPGIADVLAVHLSHGRSRSADLRREASHAVKRLAATRIRPVIVKGMHTAYAYFPAPETRPVTDVDIVVTHEELQAAEVVLQSAGYVARPRSDIPYQCDWTRPDVPAHPLTLMHVHQDDPWAFDLQATFSRHLTGGGIVDIDRIVDKDALQPWPLFPGAWVLAQPHLVLELAAHTSQNILNLNLLRLVEIVLVARKDGMRCWNGAAAKLDALGPRYVYPALSLSERLAPGTVPVAILRQCENDAPAHLRRMIANLDLWGLQCLDRHDLAARYMWRKGPLDGLRLLLLDFVPSRSIPPHRWPAYYFERTRAVCRIR